MDGAIIKQEKYRIMKEPYYEPVLDEVEIFNMAFNRGLHIALTGPTGCGKTTLTEYMSYQLGQNLIEGSNNGKIKISKTSEGEKQQNGDIIFPYIEIACHEDLSESHLVGRYDINNDWLPGPLYLGAQYGGIVVLDEIVEARKDAIVLLHGLTDDRRVLSVAKQGKVLKAPENFMVVACYNPGYQVKNKDLKPSTKQRFVTIKMDYPDENLETKILIEKTGIKEDMARKFVTIGNEIRQAKQGDQKLNLQEGASTRLLINACKMYLENKNNNFGVSIESITRATILNPILSDDTDVESLEKVIETVI